MICWSPRIQSNSTWRWPMAPFPVSYSPHFPVSLSLFLFLDSNNVIVHELNRQPLTGIKYWYHLDLGLLGVCVFGYGIKISLTECAMYYKNLSLLGQALTQGRVWSSLSWFLENLIQNAFSYMWGPEFHPEHWKNQASKQATNEPTTQRN